MEYHSGSAVEFDDFRPLLDQFETKVSRYLARDELWTANELVDIVKSREAGLWAVRESNSYIALAISRVVYYGVDDGPWLEVLATVGRDFSKWIDGLLVNLLLYTGQEKLKGIRSVCRPGMSKWLCKRGFRLENGRTEWVNEQER
jgi:hypothetical protein